MFNTIFFLKTQTITATNITYLTEVSIIAKHTDTEKSIDLIYTASSIKTPVSRTVVNVWNGNVSLQGHISVHLFFFNIDM